MLLVGNGRLITRTETEPYLDDGCVAINGTTIAGVGTTVSMRQQYPGAKMIDARGRIIMPGLINTHMHLYSTFARGMALKDSPPTNFQEILERLWWRLDKALTTEDVYYSAMVPLLDCIRNGTTTIFDHHASPRAAKDSLFTIAEACAKTGMRSVLCYEVSDRDGEEVAVTGIRENQEFIRHCKQSGSEVLQGMFGLHASFTVSDGTLARCAESAKDLDTGIHIHTAEAPEDLEHCLNLHGRRVVERLADFEILGPKTIAGHCVHVDESEMELLCATQTNAVHNPQSNMGNAVGGAPVLEMMRCGIRVGLGTDGYTPDMFESMKAASLFHKHRLQDPSVAWQEPPLMLFENNRAIAETYFPRTIGRIETDAYADMIVVDYDPPTPMEPGNLNGHVLFGMSGRCVDTTIIHGRVVMLERRFTEFDEREVYAKARELAAALWRRF
jgi:putative selenium metabolism protein SsnA